MPLGSSASQKLRQQKPDTTQKVDTTRLKKRIDSDLDHIAMASRGPIQQGQPKDSYKSSASARLDSLDKARQGKIPATSNGSKTYKKQRNPG